jgi:hypothetical protein
MFRPNDLIPRFTGYRTPRRNSIQIEFCRIGAESQAFIDRSSSGSPTNSLRQALGSQCAPRPVST